jgi:uncharacterized phage protein gp47/JayE
VIDEKILDEILPIPDIEELKEATVEELKSEGFTVTNFNSGGIFYTLLMIVFWVRIELVKLQRSVLNNMFVTHAQGAWLELKAADYSKKRKVALKTRGIVTISRTSPGEARTISAGHVFKTQKDINGEELRFFALENTVLQQNALSVGVPVEAEKEGAKYNVAFGQITRSLTHIEGIESISNLAGWITREGSDIEDYESLRERTLNSWADVATMPIAQKYKNVCEAVPGVLFVRVDDQHPRGQGTIDIIVTSTAGAATEALLSLVGTAANAIKGPYDNLLVKSSTISTKAINVTVSVEAGTNTDGLADRVKATILANMKISKSRKLNELLHSDLIFAVRRDIPAIVNLKVTEPDDDLVLDTDIVIIPGAVTVTIQEV